MRKKTYALRYIRGYRYCTSVYTMIYDANKIIPRAYNYLWFCFLFCCPAGVFLCIAITYTNLAVMKALCMKDSPLNKHNTLLRRTSKGMSLACNAATREERSFGWLMFFLCVAFVLCWLPQLVRYYIITIIVSSVNTIILLYYRRTSYTGCPTLHRAILHLPC